MKYFILFLISFYFISITCYGQLNPLDEKWINEVEYENKLKNFNHPSAKGSPFYSKKFIKGSLYLKNGEDIEDIIINYNMVEDVFLFQKSQRIFKINNNEDVKKIKLDNKTFVHSTFLNCEKKTQKGFLIALAEGKCKLYKRINKKFKEAKEEEPYSPSEDAHFEEQKPEYYIKTSTMETIECFNNLWNKKILKTFFPNSWNNKFMEKFFPEKKEKLLKLVEEHNIKLTEEKGLIEFVNHYNSLK